MPYAEGRIYYDADSHLMELPEWLEEFADEATKSRLRPLYLGGAGALADQAVAEAERRKGDEAAAAALEGALMKAKGWNALGAFDPAERSRALDLLGFERQLVFSTFAATQFSGSDLDLLYGGTSAHNRGVAGFCGQDDRLLAVANVPWADPERTIASVREAIELGCRAVQVPSHPGRGQSPTHSDYSEVWATLEEADVPFMLHIGGGGRTLRPAFHDNGRPVSDFLGGGENIRAKDYMTIHQPPEQFLSAMVLDGMFERFPRLRGGCIEQGAMWIVPWLRRLDLAQDTFARTEPTLSSLPMRASDYVHRQLWFTPFPTEPVGWIIDQTGDDLLLFSSDYPHPEGGRDPLGRFEASLGEVPETARESFYSRNFAAMMGSAIAS
ncbi:MAG TPA: amidohydrolase family protein [Acidimicrobiales bacterium]|jgi:predicted TIM-barrel fold metal-dependent hydrolase|nr:amidohydrolase family protein [Acidimicrobiales bacterium]